MPFFRTISTFAWILLIYVLMYIAPEIIDGIPKFNVDTVIYEHLLRGAKRHAMLKITIKDFFILLGMLALLMEIYKAATSKQFNNLESIFSIMIAVFYLILFISQPFAHNSLFLILTLMAFIDGIGGFMIETNSARRDIMIGG
jgi:hypothetical protein